MENLKKDLVRSLDSRDLFGAALHVSGIRDVGFDASPYVGLMERVCRSARRTGKNPSQTDRIVAINEALYGQMKMSVNTGSPRLVIDDPDRFFMDRVIDKRSGSPLSMAILYWTIADAVGLHCDCLALPSYYLLRVIIGKKEVFIDPFEAGRILSSEEFSRKFRSAMNRSKLVSTSLFEKLNRSQLVARLIQHLKQIFVLKSNPLMALRSVELLIGLFPESPEFARDRGILYCEMEYFSKAKDDLGFYLAHRRSGDDRSEIKRLSRMLRGYREVVN